MSKACVTCRRSSVLKFANFHQSPGSRQKRRHQQAQIDYFHDGDAVKHLLRRVDQRGERARS